jgi:hypothetical protein
MGFFFGAGASIEFGIPSLAQITSSFAIEIGRKGVGKEEKMVFDQVYQVISESIWKRQTRPRGYNVYYFWPKRQRTSSRKYE